MLNPKKLFIILIKQTEEQNKTIIVETDAVRVNGYFTGSGMIGLTL